MVNFVMNKGVNRDASLQQQFTHSAKMRTAIKAAQGHSLTRFTCSAKIVDERAEEAR